MRVSQTHAGTIDPTYHDRRLTSDISQVFEGYAEPTTIKSHDHRSHYLMTRIRCSLAAKRDLHQL
jgi:hypothetical protein